MDCTERIAEFVAGTAFEAIPSQAVETARTAIIDSIGCTLAGSKEKSAQICAQLAREETAVKESTLIGQGFKSSALLASLVNGTASHALDYDASFVQGGQPMAGLVATVFSLGESLSASGRDVLTAYIVGFEVTAKLVGALSPQMGSSWHSTATVGSIGATAACARLLQLKPHAVQMALGISASMASGIVSNFATMTKPLHAGLAAKNGVLAAKLAARGFTSSPGIFDRPRGFFQAFSKGLPINEGALNTLGREFDLIEHGIRIKPYPCGGLTHTAVRALLDVRRQHEISPGDVERIRVAVGQHAYEAIAYARPENGLQGKFSMPYVLARALMHGRLALDHFTDEAVKDPRVTELAEKISMEQDSTFADAEGRRPAYVTIELKNGSAHSHRADFPRGSKDFPLSPEEFREKFVECAGKAVEETSIDQILEHLKALEKLQDLKPLCKLLMGKDRN